MARGRDSEHRSKEPSRSSSRERDRSPLRASNDTSHMTSNPVTVNARIFVGSITANITREELEDHFSRWGNVVGVTLTKNKFGFVQFEKESEAQACLASGYTTTLKTAKLNVKPARIGMGQMAAPAPAPGVVGMPIPGPSSGGGWGAPPRGGGYGLSRDHGAAPEEDFYDPYYRRNEKGREEAHLRYADYYRDYYDRPSGNDAGESYYRREAEERPPPPRSYESPRYPSPPPEPLDPLDPARPNDVEIVVPNKQQRAYAESIESHLKRLGMLVDLLFPPPDIPPSRVLCDLSARRCLYAVFATAENEKHNSLTLNILHGDPQEHRNMPVEDAMRLVQRHFEDYVKKSRLRNLREVVPRDVRNLLVDLMQSRPLSMGDLDKLIKYLRERQNALVDDQIEQKREIAGTQTSMIAGGMAVTYPGYNYLSTTVPGTVTATSHTSIATAPQGVIHGAAPQLGVAQPNPVTLVSSPSVAAAIAAYPATAYSTFSTGMVGAYGLAPPQMAPPQMAPPQMAPPQMAPPQMGPPPPTHHQMIPAPSPAAPENTPKQSDLQERILNLMKSQGTLPANSMAVPSGVPPPTGVPPPSVVPAPRIMQQPQQQQQMWVPQQQQLARANENNGKGPQGSQAAYNPWSQ